MDTAAHRASISSRPRWIFALLTVTALSSACSYFPRSSLDSLSPETQTRVASSLEQSPPDSAARYPRGVPYQPLDDEERRLLETQVIPQLYGVAPPTEAPQTNAEIPAMASAEAAASAPAPTTPETMPTTPSRHSRKADWTPYRALSAEERAFLEDEVYPRLSPGTTTSVATARRRVEIPSASPSGASPRMTSPREAPTTTEPTGTATPEAQTVMTAPPEAPATTTPSTVTAPGPRRDRLETAVETPLPGPRVENLESASQVPVEEPILPVPETAPVTPEVTPSPAAPPTTPAENSEDSETPEARFPRAGEAVAATGNPVTTPATEETDTTAASEPRKNENADDTTVVED